MKILFIDTKLTGHHEVYLKSLISTTEGFHVIMSQNVNFLNENECDIVPYNHSFFSYLKWLKKIKQIAHKENVDLIHFLYGDIFYRFFGIGLTLLKEFKVIITFHHVNFDKLRNISIKRIFKSIYNGVVHTACLEKCINSMGISNVTHIEYPHFGDGLELDKNKSLEQWGLKADIPVLGVIGGTRYDKGIDILLDALNNVKSEFQLLIAGKEEAYTKDFILDKCKKYADRVCMRLAYLSDQDFATAFSAIDFIVLPYRKVFDGASGPLSEGVWLRKGIIGPNHGSIGEIIQNNNLGFCFASEDGDDLSRVIELALTKGFSWNDTAEKYRECLKTDNFINDYKQLYYK